MLSEWKKIDDEMELRKSRTPKKEMSYFNEETKSNRLVDSFLQQSTSIRKYKKKLKGEIGEYLKRRNNLQKVKTIESLPLPKKQR